MLSARLKLSTHWLPGKCFTRLQLQITDPRFNSTEPFYVSSLKVFLERFDFVGHPLDIALRKLLLDVGLPKETQQIDRVIEAFAKRYIQCNPYLYLSEGNYSQNGTFDAKSAIQTIPTS
jgi:hypothetical protein